MFSPKEVYSVWPTEQLRARERIAPRHSGLLAGQFVYSSRYPCCHQFFPTSAEREPGRERALFTEAGLWRGVGGLLGAWGPRARASPKFGGPIAMLSAYPRALTKPAAQPSISSKVSGPGRHSGGSYHWQSLVTLG